jgi:MYXO-CTERM domain-containing protein
MNLQIKTRALVLACGVALLAPVAMAQQPSGNGYSSTTTTDTNDDNRGYWGLLGLVGLAGLLGRRKHDTTVRRDTMSDSSPARRT